MSAIRLSRSFAILQSIRSLALGLVAAAALVAITQNVIAQDVIAQNVMTPTASQLTTQSITQPTTQSAMLALPDSPGTVSSSSSSAAAASYFDPAPAQAARTASPSDQVITPGQQAPALTPRDKLLMGTKSTISPFAAIGWVASAGWSHLTNGPPNYGTDSGAFGQRLGAAALCNSSQDFLSTSIMATLLHEDPRYYKLGRSHSIGKRVVYAATRALITRTDSGRATANLALLSGNLEGAILTNAYYPPSNHGVSETMKIFGSSVGGSALGFGISEFLSDALQIVHLKKAD